MVLPGDRRWPCSQGVGSLRVNGGSSNVEAGLDWTVLCLEEGPQAETHMWDTGSCGDTSGCSFPTLSPNGASSVLGGAAVQPPSLPQPAGGKSLPDPLFSLLPESKGGRETESLLSACAPGVGLAPERGLPSVGICSGSGPTQSLGTWKGVQRSLPRFSQAPDIEVGGWKEKEKRVCKSILTPQFLMTLGCVFEGQREPTRSYANVKQKDTPPPCGKVPRALAICDLARSHSTLVAHGGGLGKETHRRNKTKHGRLWGFVPKAY